VKPAWYEGEVPGEPPLIRAGLPDESMERGGEPIGPKSTGAVTPWTLFAARRRGAEGVLRGKGEPVG
jgi:hypothetical protein